MEFKDRFKQLRMEKGLAFAEIAANFQKSEAAIRSWEMGKTKPDADTLIKLSKYFDCTIDYLLGSSNRKSLDETQKDIEIQELKKKLTLYSEKLNLYKNKLNEINSISIISE